MRFIKVDGVYYDYEKYRKTILDVENALLDEIELIAARFGFKKIKSYFYNKELDVVLEISAKTRSQLEFV